MILIDSLRFYEHKRKAYAHSIHSKGDFDHLIDFYASIGLGRHFLQKSNAGYWHFDVPSNFYQLALEAGAVLVPRTRLVKTLRELGPIRPRRKSGRLIELALGSTPIL